MAKRNSKRRTNIPKNTEAVLAVLKERAHKRGEITYGELAERVGLTSKAALAMRFPLNYIRDEICLPHSRPWLWMLAVDKEEGLPGPGAMTGTEIKLKGKQHWRDLVEPVYTYDWSQVQIEGR